MPHRPKYTAFISYAHIDERVAKKLHVQLENYNLPNGILANGKQSFSPIFRDVTELTVAHSLTDKIREALEQSDFLIVLCSPAAKASKWVNEEIRLFRNLHGDRNILPAIAKGTPETAFPEALLEGGNEPLAANLQSGKESFKFGVHQIAASLLGVGLDTLVQRAERHRRLRNRFIMTGTTTLAIIFAALAYTAFQARNEARDSRDDAERLVEYMVSDLKTELYALQRLDILDGLGEEIVEYYEGIDPKDLPSDRLIRLITAIQSLADVAISELKYEKANRYLRDSSSIIDVLEKRNPNSENSLFFRAQNEYWLGLVFKRQNAYSEALPYWENYNDLSVKLVELNPDKQKWVMEAAWGSHNLSILYRSLNDNDQALARSTRAAELFKPVYDKDPLNLYVAYEYANTLSTLSNAQKKAGKIEDAISTLEKVVRVIQGASDEEQKNFKAMLYENQAVYRIFKLKGYYICLDDRYLDVRSIAEQLYLNEPNSWDFLSHYEAIIYEYLEDCLVRDPSQISSTDIELLRALGGKLSRPSRTDIFAKLKRLQSDTPEP